MPNAGKSGKVTRASVVPRCGPCDSRIKKRSQPTANPADIPAIDEVQAAFHAVQANEAQPTVVDGEETPLHETPLHNIAVDEAAAVEVTAAPTAAPAPAAPTAAAAAAAPTAAAEASAAAAATATAPTAGLPSWIATLRCVRDC